jgi:alpha-L-fucosidase
VIDLLVDIVSKNGNLLLNFPLPNSGELDADEMKVLEGITRWMAVNSEGIYGSRPWKIYGAGPSTEVAVPKPASTRASSPV